MADYLRTYLTNLDQIFSTGRYKSENMINLMFVLRQLKGRCYGNQVSWRQMMNTD